MEIPIIDYKVENIVITIPVDALIFAIENRADGVYKIMDKNQFAKDFCKALRDFQSSNATELGISEFQYFLDKITNYVTENFDSIDYQENK